MSTTITVDLGRLTPADRNQDSQVKGRIYYLAQAGHIVVAEQRLQNGWGCLVIATTGRAPSPRILVPARVIADARTSVAVGPDEPRLYAAVWHALVYRRPPIGGYMAAIAGLLATDLRIPATLTVVVDAVAEQRLSTATGLRHTGLRRLLDRLTAEHLLTVAVSPGNAGLPTYRLTIPDPSPQPHDEPAQPTPVPGQRPTVTASSR
jgi:hypothetical protein